jgi:hypothetical protein
MKQKQKVFISFDFDQDKALKDLLMAQCKLEACPFDVIDGSLKEVSPEKDWKKKAFERIRRADTVIVMLGRLTYRSPGVLSEVKMARSLGKKVIQIIGHKDQKCRRVPGGGVLYQWNWENFHKLFP